MNAYVAFLVLVAVNAALYFAAVRVAALLINTRMGPTDGGIDMADKFS